MMLPATLNPTSKGGGGVRVVSLSRGRDDGGRYAKGRANGEGGAAREVQAQDASLSTGTMALGGGM